MSLTPEVADVISRSTITGNVLVLPGQLARDLYEKVNKALVAAGGRWKRGTGHVFEDDPSTVLGTALESGLVRDAKKDRAAFYTPESIARQVAMMADVVGETVLEPSAGGGALAVACLNAGAALVNCIELDAGAAGKLVTRFPTTCGDFLTLLPPCPDFPPFTRIVMNPPFTRKTDLKHIEHALRWLQEGGLLFSIVPDGGSRPELDAMGAETITSWPAGAFRESGTDIATQLISISKE